MNGTFPLTDLAYFSIERPQQASQFLFTLKISHRAMGSGDCLCVKSDTRVYGTFKFTFQDSQSFQDGWMIGVKNGNFVDVFSLLNERIKRDGVNLRSLLQGCLLERPSAYLSSINL